MNLWFWKRVAFIIFLIVATAYRLGLDTNITKHRLNMFPEIPNFFSKYVEFFAKYLEKVAISQKHLGFIL